MIEEFLFNMDDGWLFKWIWFKFSTFIVEETSILYGE
jgi:hypothetical protein